MQSPSYDNSADKAGGKLALVTGGDSGGIGRAVATAFAKEGADVAIVHLCENSDAAETVQAVEGLGRKCLVIQADLRRESYAAEAVGRRSAAWAGLLSW